MEIISFSTILSTTTTNKLLVFNNTSRRCRNRVVMMSSPPLRRLILLRHADSSWEDRSLKAMDGQTAHHLQRAISKYATDDILTLMCMGHNKGWEEAASTLSGASIELKTCNAALLEAAGKSWDEVLTSLDMDVGIGRSKLVRVF
ncbi:histidine phosphatase superfamily protein [Tanacetum coccineum]